MLHLNRLLWEKCWRFIIRNDLLLGKLGSSREIILILVFTCYGYTSVNFLLNDAEGGRFGVRILVDYLCIIWWLVFIRCWTQIFQAWIEEFRYVWLKHRDLEAKAKSMPFSSSPARSLTGSLLLQHRGWNTTDAMLNALHWAVSSSCPLMFDFWSIAEALRELCCSLTSHLIVASSTYH